MTPGFSELGEIEEELDRLFSVPLSDFTSERNALARTLTDRGRPSEAAAIRALRKPSLAVWTANQLARRHPDELAALLELGERQRTAQQEALSGGGPGDLRSIGKERREAVSRLVSRAAEVLEKEEGVASPKTHLERVTGTLMAASDDPEGAEKLRRGLLTAELQPTGFLAALGGLSLPEETELERSGRARADEQRHAARALKERAESLAAEAVRLEAVVDDADEAAARARKAAVAAREEADAAGAQWRTAADSLAAGES